MSFRNLRRPLVGLLLASVAGCFGGGTKTDPWADYLTAQEVWKNERAMLEDFERAMGPNPSAEDKALYATLKERFEKASAHVKAVRARLPKE
ncbi:MAG TPA: hypothetical protein VFG20_19545 [Planctomycetaceae bacterium]|nr:hypothetical protein [Planctomycetaceae bacterium]